MRAGKLDTRITIEEVTEMRDNFGQPSQSWSTYAKVWADKRDVKGNELITNDQLRAQMTSIFKIRYLSGLHPKMRISVGDTIYDILSVAEIGRKAAHEITARANI